MLCDSVEFSLLFNDNSFKTELGFINTRKEDDQIEFNEIVSNTVKDTEYKIKNSILLSTYNNEDDIEIGAWLYMGKYTMDHKAFMGHGNYSDETITIIYKVLNVHSKRLMSLPLL